jgi:hypothetical protein
MSNLKACQYDTNDDKVFTRLKNMNVKRSSNLIYQNNYLKQKNWKGEVGMGMNLV